VLVRQITVQGEQRKNGGNPESDWDDAARVPRAAKDEPNHRQSQQPCPLAVDDDPGESEVLDPVRAQAVACRGTIGAEVVPDGGRPERQDHASAEQDHDGAIPCEVSSGLTAVRLRERGHQREADVNDHRLDQQGKRAEDGRHDEPACAAGLAIGVRCAKREQGRGDGGHLRQSQARALQIARTHRQQTRRGQPSDRPSGHASEPPGGD